MSGHSHFATIRRQKESKDAAKGKIFSKMARLITIAVKTGGGPNIDGNFKLQAVVEKARSYNMPKENIERAINRAGTSADLTEVTYEGFGPMGSGVIIEAATDNKNRTVAEIKNILEKGGGGLGGPGSVAYNFDSLGMILVKKDFDVDTQILKLIDLGAEDVEGVADGIEVYVSSEKLAGLKAAILGASFSILESDLVLRPKTLVSLTDPKVAQKFVDMVASLEDHDDVQKVYTNADIPEGTPN